LMRMLFLFTPVVYPRYLPTTSFVLCRCRNLLNTFKRRGPMVAARAMKLQVKLLALPAGHGASRLPPS
ncbi:MAG: hypothetical protein ACKOGL_02595, partial [Acidimicrobiaceae bacterium]